MRKGLIAAGVAVLAFAAIVTTGLAKTAGPEASSQLSACTNVSLGVNAPLTGPAGFLGQEQLSWAQIRSLPVQPGERDEVQDRHGRLAARRREGADGHAAVRVERERHGVHRTVDQPGRDHERRRCSRRRSWSRSPRPRRVSTSRSRSGSNAGFFRNVPNDGIQAPTIANYVSTKLRASDVVVVDSQDDYSVPLANAIGRILRRQNVDVSRESVPATDTDFSSIVANVGDEVDVVVFATQTASAGADAVPAAARAGQEGGRVRDGWRVLAVAVQAAARLRLGLRDRPALPARARDPSCVGTTGSRRTRPSAPSGRRPTWRRGSP